MDKLPESLLHLINACELGCDRGCCGLDAFDFDPVHIASYLIQYTGSLDTHKLSLIHQDIQRWRTACGTQSESSSGYASNPSEMNWNFTAAGVDELCDRLLHNIAIAKKIIVASEKLRFMSPLELLGRDKYYVERNEEPELSDLISKLSDHLKNIQK